MKTFTIEQNDKHFAGSQKQRVFTITKKIAKHGKQAIIVTEKSLFNYSDFAVPIIAEDLQ